MTLFKEALTNPLKTPFSENMSQSLQTVAILAAGMMLVGTAAVSVFNVSRAAFGW